MSWFDTSFSFAKSAISQAQKSIDKVLDIRDDQSARDSPEAPSITVAPSTPVEVTKNVRTTSAPTSTKLSTKATKSNVPLSSNVPSPPATSHSSSEAFDSTWGLRDFGWMSPLSSTSPTKTLNKDDSTQRSKVTPTGRSERPKKTRQKKSQSSRATSTPISEGGGASSLSSGAKDSLGKAITPVKPVEQAALTATAAETPVKDAKSAPDTLPNSADLSTIPGSKTTVESTVIADSADRVQPLQENHIPSAGTDQNASSKDKMSDSAPPTKSIKLNPDPPVKETRRDSPTDPVLPSKASEPEQAPPTSSDCVDSMDGPAAGELTEPRLGEGLAREGCVTVSDPTRSSAESNRPEVVGVSSEDKGHSATCTNSGGDTLTSSDHGDTEQTEVGGATGGEGRGLSDHTQDEGKTVNNLSNECTETAESVKTECARLSELLEARETKMVDMSRQIISLTEENQQLQQEVSVAKEMGQSDVEEIRTEFTRRIGTSEKKLQAVTKERDSLRKQLQAVQTEQSQQKKSQEHSLTKLLQEKEEQVTQLMEEGEKLSKQELQSNSTIKKLRQKERQNDQLLASQKQHIEDLESKIANLKEQGKKRDEKERKYQESLAQLNTIAEQQAKELTTLKAEKDGLTDKVRSLQTNLDNAYKELADLQKENAVSQTAAQEAAISAQSSAREELKGLLDKQKVEAQREKEAVLLQLEELRMTMTRTEQLSARKEDHLRQEIADLQERLQEAESRNQELTSTISQATKPLLRQIENIQAAHSAQAANWDRVETNFTQRLVELQAQLSQSTERERIAVEKEMTLQSKVTVLETQASSLRQEKSQLLTSEELIKAKLQTLEEEQQRESAKLEGLRTSFQQTVDDLRKDKELLERQLEYERVRLEAESKKARLEAQEKERLRSQLVNFSLSRPSVGRQSSSGSVHSQSELLERSLHSVSEPGETTPTDSVDYHAQSLKGGSASVIEQLQSLLKQKEGELSTSQTLVGTLERSRSSLAEDLSSLSAENESLKTQVKEIAPLQEKLQSVERKHEAMLQMYGEKAEEVEELKLDILDLKAMYRQQIDELLSGRR